MAEFDVVIVGAGIAGALAADALTRAGRRVLVLEAGATSKSRALLMKRYFAAAEKSASTPYADEEMAPRPDAAKPDGYYVQKGTVPFTSTYERRVGGTTWSWLGTSLRLLPSDFRMKATHGHGEDWPLGYDDLAPWYAKAETELGVSGDSAVDLGSPRTETYPNRKTPPSLVDTALGKALGGATFEDLPLRVAATPAARDPDACVGSASCVPLCPTGAKYEATVHLKRAQLRGATIREKAVASKILVGADGRIAGVEYLGWDKTSAVATGQIYVLAANAIETPKLLLMSRTAALPNGVANASGAVGRYLMDHPTQVSWALSPTPVHPLRGPLSTSGIESLRDGAFRKTRSAFRVAIGNDGWPGAPTETVRGFVAQKLVGAKLRAAVKDHVQRQLRFTAQIEQLPDAANRIVPSATLVDALGLPRPEITFGLGAYETAGLAAARRCHDLLFQKLGATEVHHAEKSGGSGDVIGTTRMGADPARAVVDGNLRSHDHDNLYILGAGVFPTAGAAPPTLTLAALALRAAKTIDAALGSS